jgi:hypothetical protein
MRGGFNTHTFAPSPKKLIECLRLARTPAKPSFLTTTPTGLPFALTSRLTDNRPVPLEVRYPEPTVMKWSAPFLAAALTPFLTATAGSAAAPSASAHQQAETLHDRKFWRAIANNRYSIPPGQQVLPLVRELSGYLGTPDPELRDDLAYTILDVWIVYRNQLTANELRSLKSDWESNLRAGIGETGTDSVLLRSFSALCLAALAERDLKSPFLSEESYRTLLNDSFTYLKEERDLRGFDVIKGWIHSTAHTADLLGALAANPRFRVEDQARVLQAISERLSAAGQIFSYGEQDRLAVAVAAIAARKDFDAAGFHRWLSTLDETDRKVWKDSPPNDALLKTFQNNNYMLQALAARLYAKPKTPEITAALESVIQVLRKR